jgi:hypothetical protein
VQPVTVLLGVLIVAAIALVGVAIWTCVELVRTARSMRTLADDTDVRLVPLLEKADVTVDALNAELLRVDAIVTRFEDISGRVESTTRTVQEVANAPGEIVNELAGRMRRAWSARKQTTASPTPAEKPARPANSAARVDSEQADVHTDTSPPASAASVTENEGVPTS